MENATIRARHFTFYRIDEDTQARPLVDLRWQAGHAVITVGAFMALKAWNY